MLFKHLRTHENNVVHRLNVKGFVSLGHTSLGHRGAKIVHPALSETRSSSVRKN